MTSSTMRKQELFADIIFIIHELNDWAREQGDYVGWSFPSQEEIDQTSLEDVMCLKRKLKNVLSLRMGSKEGER